MSSALPAPTLRDRQKEATRELILDAVSRCMEDAGLAELTFAQVASEAGISERTIYRHFPTKEALMDGFWRRLHEDLGMQAVAATEQELLDWPRRVFVGMDAQEQVVRGIMSSAQGRAVRVRLHQARKPRLRATLRGIVGDLPEPQFTRLCAVLQLLGSASAWQVLKDYWDMDGPEAAEAARDAMVTLIEAAKAASADQLKRGRT